MPVGRITRPAALGVLAASLIALLTLAVPVIEQHAAGPAPGIVVEHTAPPAPAVATKR
jgi:hypothetical protein